MLTAFSVMQDKDAFPYLELFDPEYPQRAKDIIDELAAEVEEMRDSVRDKCKYAWVFLMIFGLQFGINLH